MAALSGRSVSALATVVFTVQALVVGVDFLLVVAATFVPPVRARRPLSRH
jgi:hypothetical protein